MKPPVFTRETISAIHNVNTQYKYAMQIHNAVAQVAGDICRAKNLRKICVWSLAAWILDFAFAQSVVFSRKKGPGRAG